MIQPLVKLGTWQALLISIVFGFTLAAAGFWFHWSFIMLGIFVGVLVLKSAIDARAEEDSEVARVMGIFGVGLLIFPFLGVVFLGLMFVAWAEL